MTEPTPDNIPTLLLAVLSEPALKGLWLTSADIVPIMEAAKALQDISPGNLHTYGREATGRTTTFSTQLLDKVRNADLDSSGDKLGEVVRIARSGNHRDASHSRCRRTRGQPDRAAVATQGFRRSQSVPRVRR